MNQLLADITQSYPADNMQHLSSLSAQTGKTAILITDTNAKIIFVDGGFENLLGYDKEYVMGKSAIELLSVTSEYQKISAEKLSALSVDSPYEDNIALTKKNGQRFWVHLSASLCQLESLRCIIISLTDVTRTKLYELLQYPVLNALLDDPNQEKVVPFLCQKIEELAVDVIPSVVHIDEEGTVSQIAGPGLNSEYQRLKHQDMTEDKNTLQIKDLTEDIFWQQDKETLQPLGIQSCWSVAIKNQTNNIVAVFTLYFRHSLQPTTLHTKLMLTGNYLCQLIFEQHKKQQYLRQMAFYDPLTGLPNRSLMMAQADRVITEMARETNALAVMFVDLDRFKQINDALGHEAGDELLRTVAQRLRSVLRRSDIIGKLAGDEFVLILPRCNAAQSSMLAERVRAVFTIPFTIAGTVIKLTASIGISLYPEDGENISSLVQRADIAMYQAKNTQAGSTRFYLEEMNIRAQERLMLETELDNALQTQQLYLTYQPQVDLASGKLIGVEALARWQHPAMGMVSPLRFIALAEECGMINRLSEQILEQSFKQMALWRQKRLNIPRISINLSPINFHNPALLALLTALLEKYQLKTTDICLEVTESIILDNSPDTEKTMRQLRDMGFGLAIDDFGTGYSSLSYLRHLPVTELKLDKSFVDDLQHDVSSRALSEAVMGIGKSLSLKVIAEGIEYLEQKEILLQQGYTAGQGYLFSTPLKAAEFELWLTEQ